LSTPAEPRHAFDDSRRLTGASRWFAGPAVTLTPLLPRWPRAGLSAADAVQRDAAFARWATQVRALAAALGWPDPQPRVVPDAEEPQLLFAAPPGLLFTATEVNEWAWERAALGCSNGGAKGAEGAQEDHPHDHTHDHTHDTHDTHDVLDSFDLAHPAVDTDAAAAHFSARAAAELKPALEALRQAAHAHGLPWLEDDETLSMGGGCGSSSWPLSELPTPAAVPWAALHGVPTALVTGSNGKTTTARLVAAMGEAAGLTVGLCGTEGVRVGGQTLHSGDYSGPAGARAVLRHRAVQTAVLETARGGLLRRGLALAQADVAVVTNVSADHFGEYGIHSLDDLAEVKLTVARAVAPAGLLVLNADDAVLMHTAAQLPQAAAAAGRLALFAADHGHPALQRHREAGGATCGVLGSGIGSGPDSGPNSGPNSTTDSKTGAVLRLFVDGQAHDLGEVAALPLALGGAARFHIANMAAAALAAWGLGLPLEAIGHTLRHFGADPADNPGRLERHAHRGATVLIDYAHNPDGLAQLLAVARALQPHRLGLLLGQAGNRDDAAIAALATAAAAAAPDHIVVKELPLMLRGRALGEVPALLQRSLLAAGVDAAQLQQIDDEFEAAQALLAWAQPGDVVVLPVHTAAVREQLAALLRRAAA